jgi:hypothetical protein
MRDRHGIVDERRSANHGDLHDALRISESERESEVSSHRTSNNGYSFNPDAIEQALHKSDRVFTERYSR